MIVSWIDDDPWTYQSLSWDLRQPSIPLSISSTGQYHYIVFIGFDGHHQSVLIIFMDQHHYISLFIIHNVRICVSPWSIDHQLSTHDLLVPVPRNSSCSLRSWNSGHLRPRHWTGLSGQADCPRGYSWWNMLPTRQRWLILINDG